MEKVRFMIRYLGLDLGTWTANSGLRFINVVRFETKWLFDATKHTINAT